MRKAPSKRITLPFSVGMVKMLPTKCANSSGLPKRLGHGTLAPRSSLTASGSSSKRGVENNPGACEKNDDRVDRQTCKALSHASNHAREHTSTYNGHNSYSIGSQIPCHGQSHSHHPSFTCCIGHLPNLSFIGGN